jgi:hypothetical protein
MSSPPIPFALAAAHDVQWAELLPPLVAAVSYLMPCANRGFALSDARAAHAGNGASERLRERIMNAQVETEPDAAGVGTPHSP